MLKRKLKFFIASNIVAGIVLNSSQSVLAGFLQNYYYCITKVRYPEHSWNSDKYKKTEECSNPEDSSETYAEKKYFTTNEDDNCTNKKEDPYEKTDANKKKNTAELSKIKEYFDEYKEKGKEAFKQFVKEANDRKYVVLNKDMQGDLQGYVDYICEKNDDNNDNNYKLAIYSLELEDTEGSFELFKKYESKLKESHVNPIFIFPQ